MLVNSLLSARGKTLSADYLSGFTSPYVDVSTASYSPFVYYAYDNGLLGFLTVNKRSQNYFLPDNLITKHEIYTILAKALKTSFTYNIAEADKQYMTRGEFAQVLVDLFGLKLPDIKVNTTSPSSETGSS